MPDDAPSFLSTARAVVSPITAAPRPDRQAFVTAFTTLRHDDAIAAGFERAEIELGEEGGFEVHADGRGLYVTATLNGIDGEVNIVGLDAIREARKALQVCEAMAERMEGVSTPKGVI